MSDKQQKHDHDPDPDPEVIELKRKDSATWETSAPKTGRKRLRTYLGTPAPAPRSLDDAGEIPLATANIFVLWTFRWVSPLMRKGFLRPLEATDLWKLDASRQSYNLSEKLLANLARRQKVAAEWNKRLPTAKPPLRKRAGWAMRAAVKKSLGEDYAEFGADSTYAARRATLEKEWRTRSGLRSGSLAWAISDTYPGIWWAAPYRFISDMSTIVMPLLIKELIRFSQQMNAAKGNPAIPKPSMGKGVGLAIGLFLLNFVRMMSLAQFLFRALHEGIFVRAGLISAVYRRAIELSVGARAHHSNGKLMTHLNADITRLDQSMQFLHSAWSAPIQLVVTIILLCLQIGPSGLLGFIVFLLMAPFQGWIMKIGMDLRKKSMVWTEKRSKLLQELLGSMGIIKMFTYELPYLARLNEMRAKEMAKIRTLLFTRAGIESIAISLPTIASVFAFVMYTSLHDNLDPALLFTAIAYFNTLRQPLMLLPRAFSMIGDSLNALSRLRSLFEADTLEERVTFDPQLDVAVRATHAHFQWVAVEDKTEDEKKDAKGKGKKKGKKGEPEKEPEHVAVQAEPFSVRDLNLEVPRGRLVAIVGPVGSGKSSILQGLLGEMRTISGKVEFGGRIGYCQQAAWIQNATIRDNVLFGQEWDEVRYWRCVQEASLLPDLEIMPDGDLTEIGEQGVNLSGGQKQRINIARVLYYNADIILMDDPLSAVDAHVGKALFNEAILGLRNAGKTVLLVTHALHFLSKVDYVYTVTDGSVVEEGTYSDLMANAGAFRTLMDDFGGATAQHEEEEAAKEEEAIDLEDDERAADTAKDTATLVAKVMGKDMGKAAGTGKLEGRLITKEKRVTGAVGGRVYWAYLKAGKPLYLLPILFLAALSQASQVMSTVWITYWEADRFNRPTYFYQALYGMLGGAQALFTFFMGLTFTLMAVGASRNMFKDALRHVFFSPMSFFDTVPLGRIAGIFGKDIDQMDNFLPELLRQGILCVVMLIGGIIIIAIHFPYFVAVVAAVGIGYGYFAYYYRNTAREVKRLDSLMRSVLYSHFSESLNGFATIRAFGESKRFIQENAERVDLQDRAYLLVIANIVWLSLRLDWMGSLLVFAIAIMCVTGGGGLGAAQIALCLTYMVQITQMLNAVALLATEIENTMNCVERTLQYSDGSLAQEATYEKEADPKGPWPPSGSIEMGKLVMSYRPGLPTVLKGISVNIKPGERVGIVGRTGAGKTSITVALFRLTELTSGKITIDGTDIAGMGLRTLRSNIAIIPQDPVLFSGTLRSNLDPFNAYADDHLYDALRRARVGVPRGGQTDSRYTLDMVIDDGGANLSIGERSLVSLARALVKEARIMVLDEATAAVDLETDAEIQQAIRDECNRSNKTLLCIAHRLRTIIGWDKILVMDAGEVNDFASPLELFDKEGGVFRTMCERSSISREEIARAAMTER